VPSSARPAEIESDGRLQLERGGGQNGLLGMRSAVLTKWVAAPARTPPSHASVVNAIPPPSGQDCCSSKALPACTNENWRYCGHARAVGQFRTEDGIGGPSRQATVNADLILTHFRA
jgi:hypothetical protein